jgi:hypothetical protein
MSDFIALAIGLLVVGSMVAFLFGTNANQMKRCSNADHSFIYCVRTTWGK